VFVGPDIDTPLYRMPVLLFKTTTSSVDIYHASALVRFALDAGENAFVDAQRGDLAQEAKVVLLLSGYLLDLP
jgi:hypothetical protein